MMKKNEVAILISIILFSVCVLGILLYLNQDKNIGYILDENGEEVLSFDLDVDAYYTVEGEYGLFSLEVKDHKWRAIDVECPNHDCEKMGWSSKKLYIPIICLPNKLWVVIDE